MFKISPTKKLLIYFVIIFALNSCAKEGFFKGGDARKTSPNPKERVKKNLEEGRGFRINDAIGKGGNTNFEFASSNELWRASLDILDFMPLTSANYSGGVIITDWYSEQGKTNESIKITIRFLTNEVRSDALDVSVFYKKCKTITNCSIVEQDGNLSSELTKEILKKAAVYAKQMENKDFKPYEGPTSMDNRT